MEAIANKKITSKDVKIDDTAYNIKFSIEHTITVREASKLQENLGYHPAGYGMYGFSSINGKSTWHCSKSCD